MAKNNGWIKLHRLLLDHPHWLAEPFTRGQAWVDLLLLANHKEGYVRKRGVLVVVDRGCVAWSERALAERWRWSREKVRRFLKELIDRKQISRIVSPKTIPKNTSVSSLICITKYDEYQMGETEDRTENETTNKKNKKNKKKTSCEISEEISVLSRKYDPTLLQEIFEAISSTRKTGKIADSVKHRILSDWEKYPIEIVMEGIRTYLEKGYARQGKSENYLLGIIRKSNGTEATTKLQGNIMKNTGSSALNDYYRKKGFTIS